MNCPDPSDRASELEALALQSAMNKQALDAARSRAKIRPVGVCHNCEEKLDNGQLFCDADCRDDWQRRLAAKARNGA